MTIQNNKLSHLTKVIVSRLAYHSKSDQEFCELIQKFFTVNVICKMLEIDRNRYNYLVRTSQLDQHILLLKGSDIHE